MKTERLEVSHIWKDKNDEYHVSIRTEEDIKRLLSSGVDWGKRYHGYDIETLFENTILGINREYPHLSNEDIEDIRRQLEEERISLLIDEKE